MRGEKDGVAEYMRYTKYILHMAGITGKKYGLPSLSPNNPMSGAIVLGIEELFSNLLGIQQLSVAMRRSPDKIEEFINRWDPCSADMMGTIYACEALRMQDKGGRKYNRAYRKGLFGQKK